MSNGKTSDFIKSYLYSEKNVLYIRVNFINLTSLILYVRIKKNNNN